MYTSFVVRPSSRAVHRIKFCSRALPVFQATAAACTLRSNKHRPLGHVRDFKPRLAIGFIVVYCCMNENNSDIEQGTCSL